MWRVVFSKQAAKDAKKLSASGLKAKAQSLIDVLTEDPFATPPRYERLVGDLAGMYSRRINIQHRLVYEVFEEERIVRVLRMWTHYECDVLWVRTSTGSGGVGHMPKPIGHNADGGHILASYL